MITKIKNRDKELLNELSKIISEVFAKVYNSKVPEKVFLNLLLTLSKEVKENPLRTIEIFAYSSKRDFEAARILYGNSYYDLAIFHLQQCVEKITKSYALLTGVIREEDLYSRGKPKSKNTIGHHSPKAFVILLKKNFSKEYFKFFNYLNKEGFRKLEENIKEFERLINKKELMKISEDKIISFLKEYDIYKGKFINIINELRKRNRLSSSIYLLRNGILARSNNIFSSEIQSKIKKLLNERNFKKIMGILIVSIPALIYLYPLTIITYPHYISTRYPSKEGLTPQDYKEGLGIVDSFPQIEEFIREVITSFEELLKKYGS